MPDHPRSLRSSEAPGLAPGTIVAGKLRVLQMLGIGGMGTVYEVEHQITKHRRALKILHEGASASIVERFVREASAAARIGNAHVAETFDAGTLETGQPYLLMELLEGETLEQRLRRTGPIDPGELGDLIHQACDGIQAAHDAGIVHRDLKPENLFLMLREGAPFVKVLDFGISKFDEERTGALGITEEGSIMGTPYYMSPEQVRASTSIDLRTDVYALGVMLYECACGVRPYDAASISHLAVLIHEGKAVPLAVRRPSLPPAFCEVVHRAMAVDRAMRFESARALAAALAPFRTRTVVPAGASPSDPPPRIVVRPSARPLAQSGEAPPVSATVPAISPAVSVVPAAPAPLRRTRRTAAFAVAALVGLGAAFAAVRLRPSSTAVPSMARPAESTADKTERGAPPPPVELAPLATASSAEMSRDAGAPAALSPRTNGSTTTASPERSSGGTRSDLSPPTPRAPPSASSRVDQKGLAGENPFR